MSDKPEKKEQEKPKYPYVEFARIKKLSGKDEKGNEFFGKEERETWFLNVTGVHNQVDKLNKFKRRGSIVVGYGNLDAPPYPKEDTYKDMRNACKAEMGVGLDSRLFEKEVAGGLDSKVKREQAARS